MNRTRISSVFILGAAAALFSSNAPAAGSSETPAVPAKDFACGDKGKPPCPMQAWMKANMGPAVANGDAAKLKEALETVAQNNPDAAKFADWSKIAAAGAEKAKQNDVDGAKKACKSCHDQYKAKSREELRDAPFPKK